MCGGTFDFTDTDISEPGSIPACAGEPADIPATACSSGVYPRVCGGTFGRLCCWYLSRGLSPRVRGNLDSGGHRERCQGSIPACAGEPLDQSCRQSSNTVYPRVCGGTIIINVELADGEGLSPRVRGNQCCPTLCLLRGRSIPACAGEPAITSMASIT